MVASVDVRGEIDLVVWWRGSTQPSSDLLEQLRLLARLAGSARRQDGGALSSLYAVARQLLASRDREEVLLGLATAAADVLDAEIAGVFLSTPDGTHLEAQAVVGHRSMATARLRLARGESMVGHVFATGEVYRSDDWTTDPVISKRLLPVATTEGTKSCIGAPMRLEGVVVGVLAAWRRRRSVYTDVDVALIATLADLAALGVARALDDDRLRDLSEQLMTANAELAQRTRRPGRPWRSTGGSCAWSSTAPISDPSSRRCAPSPVGRSPSSAPRPPARTAGSRRSSPATAARP